MTEQKAQHWRTPKELELVIRDRLKEVMDPELHIDIVSLGLIYGVTARMRQLEGDVQSPFVHILLTLTTPGCPLAGAFDGMIRSVMTDIAGFDAQKDLDIELTFDPPWVPDLMDPEARAQLDMLL